MHSELEMFMHKLREKCFEFSAICIQESWLSTQDNYEQMNITGYDLIPQGKSCSAKGVLIIYLHDTFRYTPTHKVNKSLIWEGQFINVYGGGLPRKLILGNIYRPYDINENYNKFIDEFKHVISNLGNKSTEVIVTGNTNIDLLKINEREVFSAFFDTITSHSFYPSITIPTTFSNTRGTLIDNFFCKLSNTTLNVSSGILIKQFSDHKPYFICLEKLKKNNTPPNFVKIKIQNN